MRPEDSQTQINISSEKLVLVLSTSTLFLLTPTTASCQPAGMGSNVFEQPSPTSAQGRQLVDPSTGRPTFTGNNRQLTDPATGRSTFNGYSLKLTDPVTGESTFKGYGQNPLMNGRNSAPDFKWSSNVNAAGRSEYTGFGREPLTTSNGRSTFVGNNRRLTGTDGRSTFRGNFRSLATPSTRRQFMQNYQAFPNQDSSVKMGGHNVGGSYEDSGSVHSDTTSDAGGATNGQTDAVQPEPGVSEADSENTSNDELFNKQYDSVEADSLLQKAPEKKRRFQPENEGEGP